MQKASTKNILAVSSAMKPRFPFVANFIPLVGTCARRTFGVNFTEISSDLSSVWSDWEAIPGFAVCSFSLRGCKTNKAQRKRRTQKFLKITNARRMFHNFPRCFFCLVGALVTRALNVTEPLFSSPLFASIETREIRFGKLCNSFYDPRWLWIFRAKKASFDWLFIGIRRAKERRILVSFVVKFVERMWTLG